MPKMPIPPELRAMVEKRIRDQLDRHFSINPNTDPKKIIELQIKQDKELFERQLEQLRDSDEKDGDLHEIVLRSLVDDVLPELERSFKGRYSTR